MDCLTSFSGWCSSFWTEQTAAEEVVYEVPGCRMTVPIRPLAYGSIAVAFGDSTELYNAIQKVTRVWKEQGIHDYLVYQKVKSENPRSLQEWEIVPYPKEGFAFWQQFKVLWNISFSPWVMPQTARHKIAEELRLSFDRNLPVENSPPPPSSSDAFCNAKVIEKQLILEGREINCLYNYAPVVLGEGKLHFLITPKAHREKFSDVTLGEYTETMALAQRIVEFYKAQGISTAYLFHKTGVRAGQTVPHWHVHIVLTASKTEERIGQLRVFKNMLFGASPLSQKELQSRVDALKKNFLNPLNGGGSLNKRLDYERDQKNCA